MRDLDLEEMKDLLAYVEREIDSLPPSVAREQQMEYRSKIETNIRSIMWAQSPGSILHRGER